MASMNPVVQYSAPNRRRRVRHKIQAPAYASFTGASKGKLPDLNEILDISEDGVAVHCAASLEMRHSFDLCLDLAEATGQIYTNGQVVWSDGSGRCGFRFSDLPPASLFHLREWLFLNAMAGVANAQARRENAGLAPEAASRPSHTETLDALHAVEKEVESAGPDLAAALQLIAARAQALTRASGAAIALIAANPDFMVCRASSGPDAPPTGARLQIGSGFSGECVRSGKLLRCDDTETDDRVDRESCRALGLRSALATPIKAGGKVIGLLEVLSSHPFAFTDADDTTLRRLSDVVLAAVNRAGRHDNPATPAAKPVPFSPSPGSVLFASETKQSAETSEDPPAENGIHLPRSYLLVLVCAAATIFLVLGYYLAPGIQARFEGRESVSETVLASSRPPTAAVTSQNSVDTASLPQLQQMAAHGDAAAENALGLLYAQGDDKEGISHDEKEAARWFTKAAEHGNIVAQSKLGSLYWSGRGVPQDFNKAYFWTVLGRAGGDPASKALAPFVAARLTSAQAQSIEQQAEAWFQQHQPQSNSEAHR
jgi:TPR repeat protein/putative methionine-R-sulfoxide reductase with GAF domain